ncbi:PspC domain-containing protein [Streptomyces sp. RB6PN25]|uniref:PspC domain-containing protein n=1 Tax=Streptomyces humicola TaxID=2953240 RepID=A0ABT1PY69_9ACTN|nr:PspC domain-containing protein [Streptomyces humicola]MCQ4082602.1 PspC domain-containing protein [Streptomyces humicola]
MTEGMTGDGTAEDGAPGDARPGLTRSPRQKVVGGVCGGLGQYLDLDPVIFRVVLAVLALTGGVGLIAYGIGWLLIPMDGEEETELRRLLSGRVDGPGLTAVLCALVGSGLFLSTIDNSSNEVFSACLVGATAAAVYWSQQRRRQVRAGHADREASYANASATTSDAPPAAQPPPADATTASWWRSTPGRTGPGTGTGYLWGPEEVAGDASGDATTWPADAPYDGRQGRPPRARDRDRGRDRTRPPYAPPVPRERSSFGVVTFLFALAAAAVAVAVSWHHHPLGTTLQTGLVAALGVFGLGLIISAFMGRRSGGTVVLALLTTMLLAGAAALPTSIGTDWRPTIVRPATASQVLPQYKLRPGDGRLDLSGLDLKGSTVTSSVEMGAGRLLVLAPQNATVQVNAKVGVGDLDFPELGPHDITVKPGIRRSVTLYPPAGTKSAGTITLDLKLGIGQVEVERGPLPAVPAAPAGPAAPRTSAAQHNP